MTPARGLILVLLLAAVGVAVWRFTSDDAAEKPKDAGPAAPRPFAELKPVAEAPAGFRWDHYDGGDFVVWRLIDKEMNGDAPRSGLAIHLSREAKKSADNAKLTSKPGRFAGQDVVWLIEGKPAVAKADKDKVDDEPPDDEKPASDKSGGTPHRQDAYFDSKYDAVAEPVGVHVWIWADSEEHFAELTKLAEGMAFVSMRKK